MRNVWWRDEIEKDLSTQQLKSMEALGQEATNERITRLEGTVKHLQKMITDMELVLIEVSS